MRLRQSAPVGMAGISLGCNPISGDLSCLQFTSQAAQQLHLFSSSAFYCQNIQKHFSRQSIQGELRCGFGGIHHLS